MCTFRIYLRIYSKDGTKTNNFDEKVLYDEKFKAIS